MPGAGIRTTRGRCAQKSLVRRNPAAVPVVVPLVDALIEQAFCFTVQLSRLPQADFAVNAQAKRAVFTCKAVAVTPVFTALRRDKQVQSAAIKELARSFGGFGLSDGDFCEGHRQKVRGGMP